MKNLWNEYDPDAVSYTHLVSNDNGFKAKVEIDVKGKNGTVQRKAVTVKPNDDLFLLSGERDLYEGYTVAGIDLSLIHI